MLFCPFGVKCRTNRSTGGLGQKGRRSKFWSRGNEVTIISRDILRLLYRLEIQIPSADLASISATCPCTRTGQLSRDRVVYMARDSISSSITRDGRELVTDVLTFQLSCVTQEQGRQSRVLATSRLPEGQSDSPARWASGTGAARVDPPLNVLFGSV